MTTIPLRRARKRDGDHAALAAALAERVDGEVRFDDGTRAAYSTDASNFRQVPIGVVIPRSVDAAVEAIATCRDHGAPVLSRGGGTSLAGQCTNAGVVIDWSKYCNRLRAIDLEARTCLVEPGIVLDSLNHELAAHGLSYGPEPATHPNCTLGGMIGNNSCGATAQRSGKVVDNVARLEVLTYAGTRFWCGETTDEELASILADQSDPRAPLYRRLAELRDEYADEIRRRYPDIPRRVSGYNLDSLLPEHRFDVAGLLVGSESTLVTVLHAELELLPVLPERTLVVLGFPDIATAADAVPAILPHEPIALEGIDERLIHDEQIKRLNPIALDELPEGRAFLMVQFGGDSRAEVDERAEQLVHAIGESKHRATVAFLDHPEQEDELWRVREGGLGATAHVPGHADTWEGWEDSAVAPERLGDYLRDLEALYEEFGYASDAGPSLYGHFGQGCVHTRIPFGLTSAEGVATYRRFLVRAAELVASYGGSFSGEHGDGQSRGELLPIMFGEEIMRAFAELKALLDPDGRMNPGKVVSAARLDEHLRLGRDWAPQVGTTMHFSYPDDGGSFATAATRCVGVGKCRQHGHRGGTVMCPSYQATMEEEHSPRGRSRLLFEMLGGHGDSTIKDGWRSTAIRDALDLCLACKGCKSDCPVNVDVATYKAEFLSHHYEGRLRPRAHYALGWLPASAALVRRLHLVRLVNLLGHAPPLPRLATAAAGLAPREIPRFADQSLRQWWRRRDSSTRPGTLGRVMLWADTFTDQFHPEVGKAAVSVIERAGWEVVLPPPGLCCGLTWISTGQLEVAKNRLRATIAALAEHLHAGGLVVGLEPSCLAVFRSDAAELLGDDVDAKRLRAQSVTLAELLLDHTPGWRPPDLGGVSGIAQVHCHHHAVLGWETDRRLLERAGAAIERLDSGCCGLAGNFGFEAGHLEISKACAEQALLPAIRASAQDDVVLADGFSCRTQIHELGGGEKEAVHLAVLLEHHEALKAARREGKDTHDGKEAHHGKDTHGTRPRRVGVTALALAGAASLAVALRRMNVRRMNVRRTTGRAG
ncbi:MAG TPA: FAD-binding and (Fe-S)-binding domain-containing protein [Acidimicrobiales bacterium]|nr:FAD-binding and (Fe-S)-binding domain-containing protein [Acidimicrobiales bacterium]